MASSYVVLVVFSIVALAIPGSIILFSRLIRHRKPSSSASRLNFESGEHTIGVSSGIVHEYFHYFTSFLAFEVVAVVLIFWVYAVPSVSMLTDIYVFGFLAFAVLLQYVVILFAAGGAPSHG